MTKYRIHPVLILCLGLSAAPLSAEEMAPAASAAEPAAAEAAAPEVAAPEAEAPEAAAEAAPAEAAKPQGRVARSQFTSAVENRSPSDRLERLAPGTEKVIYFSDLRGLNGQTVTHLWEHGEQVMAEVKFEVKGDRWRVWSSKQLMPEWHGEWHVTVLDGAGRALHSERFVLERPEE